MIFKNTFVHLSNGSDWLMNIILFSIYKESNSYLSNFYNELINNKSEPIK